MFWIKIVCLPRKGQEMSQGLLKDIQWKHKHTNVEVQFGTEVTALTVLVLAARTHV